MRKSGTPARRRCRRRMARPKGSQIPASANVLAVGRGRRVLGLLLIGLAATVLFAPVLVTLATCEPAVAAAIRPPNHVIRVHPFEDLNAGQCVPGLPLHVGPIRQLGRLTNPGLLMSRMTEAVERCSTPSSGSLTLGVTVDARGNIRAIETGTGDDEALAICAIRFMRGIEPTGANGPGTLRIGYFMGLDFTSTRW
jgi:hypothetical protein